MNKLFHSDKIEVRDSSIHGRGIFAREDIKGGEMLEECHYIVIDDGNKAVIKQSQTRIEERKVKQGMSSKERVNRYKNQEFEKSPEKNLSEPLENYKKVFGKLGTR